MGRNPPAELLDLLKPYADNIVQHALTLRTLVLSIAPQANEVVFDTYNAVSLAFTYTERWRDAFCHIAVYPKHINLGVNRGAETPDPDHRLQGTGKQIRHLSVRSGAEVNEPYLHHLLSLAHAQVAHTLPAEHVLRAIVRVAAGPKRRPAPQLPSIALQGTKGRRRFRAPGRAKGALGPCGLALATRRGDH